MKIIIALMIISGLLGGIALAAPPLVAAKPDSETAKIVFIKEDYPGYQLKVGYAQLDGQNTPEKYFNQISLSRALELIDKFKTEFINTPPSPNGFKWDMDIEAQVKTCSSRLVSVYFYGGIYQGGAHPNPYYSALNYDLEKTRELKPADLFIPQANYLKVLADYCTPQLLKLGLPDDDWVKRGSAAKEENYGLFYLDGSNLVVVFPPYQVAPYSSGAQEIKIPVSELKNQLKPGGILNP